MTIEKVNNRELPPRIFWRTSINPANNRYEVWDVRNNTLILASDLSRVKEAGESEFLLGLGLLKEA